VVTWCVASGGADIPGRVGKRIKRDWGHRQQLSTPFLPNEGVPENGLDDLGIRNCEVFLLKTWPPGIGRLHLPPLNAGPDRVLNANVRQALDEKSESLFHGLGICMTKTSSRWSRSTRKKHTVVATIIPCKKGARGAALLSIGLDVLLNGGVNEKYPRVLALRGPPASTGDGHKFSGRENKTRPFLSEDVFLVQRWCIEVCS
jgi:hypothetical protein